MDFFAIVEQLRESSGALSLALAIALTLLLYYAVFRVRLRSIFDPLTVVVGFSAFASAFLIVLVNMGFVSVAKAGFVALCLGLLYLPLLAFGADRKQLRPVWRVQVPKPGQLLVLLVFHAGLQAIIYIGFGIPLLQDSRLTTFAAGGGIGVLSRLKDGIEFAAIVLAFIALRAPRRRHRLAWALLLSTAVSLLLSGSKGGILALPFGWYLAQVYCNGRWSLPKWSWRRRFVTFAALLAVPLAVLMGQGRGQAPGLNDVVQALALRVVAEGDGYAYFLADDRIDSLATRDLLAVIRPVLTMLRLAPTETAITPGFEVVRELFGDDTGGWGPNTRLPIYILYFYGAGGLALAPLFGMLLVWARRAVLASCGRSPIRFAILASVYAYSARIEVDPQITVNGWLNVALVCPILVVLALAWQTRPGGQRRVPLPPLRGGAAWAVPQPAR